MRFFCMITNIFAAVVIFVATCLFVQWIQNYDGSTLGKEFTQSIKAFKKYCNDR